MVWSTTANYNDERTKNEARRKVDKVARGLIRVDLIWWILMRQNAVHQWIERDVSLSEMVGV
jgi:hypothetical protein